MSIPEEEEQKKVVPARTKRSSGTSIVSRTAKDVIDQAIYDNRPAEYLLYSFAVLFVLSGVITLIVGAFRNEGLLALAGGIASGLFYPAMRLAKQIRQENIAIRLGELPLSKAETSHEAAIALKEFFVDTFRSHKANH